jgi:integrase
VALEVIDSILRRVNRDFVFGEGKGGFSGWSKAKAALDAQLGLKPWRLHDLRRTASTRMADARAQPHIIEAVLNHVSGHKAGVAGVYNRSTYENEKRAALDALSNYIMVAVANADSGNVHRLNRA